MLHLEGSCRCGAVTFTCDSHAPVPYQLCYCSICRKTAGGGGYAINLSAVAATLKIVEGREALGVYRAEIADDEGRCEISTGQRHFCTRCASALWLYDPDWPELLHPFASAINTELPEAPVLTHLMLDDKPDWVPLHAAEDDKLFPLYPDESIEDWHRRHGLWRA